MRSILQRSIHDSGLEYAFARCEAPRAGEVLVCGTAPMVHEAPEAVAQLPPSGDHGHTHARGEIRESGVGDRQEVNGVSHHRVAGIEWFDTFMEGRNGAQTGLFVGARAGGTPPICSVRLPRSHRRWLVSGTGRMSASKRPKRTSPIHVAPITHTVSNARRGAAGLSRGAHGER